jgi:hypothetical protein
MTHRKSENLLKLIYVFLLLINDFFQIFDIYEKE